SDDIGHLLVTGQVQNVGDGDAIFVNVTIRAFGQGGRLLETQSTFVNGFSGITSTGLFINTTLPRGRAASFQKDFAIAFLGDTQRVEFSITFMADQVNAPRANLAVTSLTRVINAAGGSDYMARVRNTGTVAARGPQVIIDGFNRGNQLFNVVIAGNGDLNDALQPNQERVFMASDVLDFDQTRVNDAHAIWIDAGASTITDPALLELKGKAFEEKRNELIEMQKLTHKFILKISKSSDK
ncbi:MAG: hypothetical protein JNN15_14770, partial [Blastocatellia bacterium]|nr:hypothetical protein [Blastocatellia bacterium]